MTMIRPALAGRDHRQRTCLGAAVLASNALFPCTRPPGMVPLPPWPPCPLARPRFKRGQAGVPFSADTACGFQAYPDVWGSAYLVALNLSTPARRKAAMAAMVGAKETYFRAGQVRSLPFPQLWTRCDFAPGGQGHCAANGTYQNGAYWATPLSYVTAAMIGTGHADFAEELLAEAVADFKTRGIYEDVDDGYPAHSKGVLNYTASATSALWAAKLLRAHRRGANVGWGSTL